MNNNFVVSIIGPDKEGMYTASIGQYIRIRSTHMDDEIRSSISEIANQRANLVMESADTGLVQTLSGQPVTTMVVKEDLIRFIQGS